MCSLIVDDYRRGNYAPSIVLASDMEPSIRKDNETVLKDHGPHSNRILLSLLAYVCKYQHCGLGKGYFGATFGMYRCHVPLQYASWIQVRSFYHLTYLVLKIK